MSVSRWFWQECSRWNFIFCSTRGVGKRCVRPDGFNKSAQSPSNLCIAHRGMHPDGCAKDAQCGSALCSAHGGGKRSAHLDGCKMGAVGATSFCAAHEGRRRCKYYLGCNKHVVKEGTCKSHGCDAGLWN